MSQRIEVGDKVKFTDLHAFQMREDGETAKEIERYMQQSYYVVEVTLDWADYNIGCVIISDKKFKCTNGTLPKQVEVGWNFVSRVHPNEIRKIAEEVHLFPINQKNNETD